MVGWGASVEAGSTNMVHTPYTHNLTPTLTAFDGLRFKCISDTVSVIPYQCDRISDTVSVIPYQCDRISVTVSVIPYQCDRA
jgi:hypothetical protein